MITPKEKAELAYHLRRIGFRKVRAVLLMTRLYKNAPRLVALAFATFAAVMLGWLPLPMIGPAAFLILVAWQPCITYPLFLAWSNIWPAPKDGQR